jgi:hypothetical protein
MNFEDEYLDVLHNLEFSIQSVYSQHPSLLDYDVDAAINKLITEYQQEQKGGSARTPRALSNAGQNSLYEAIQEMCNLHLGRTGLHTEDNEELAVSGISLQELILCLKRIRKSVNTWTARNGRQGYLNFTKEYVK